MVARRNGTERDGIVRMECDGADGTRLAFVEHKLVVVIQFRGERRGD